MMYLGEKEGRFFPQDLRGKYEVTQWVIWQMANQGPKLGECGHFRRAGPDAGDLTYAIRRFTDEANRLYGVMNNRLYDRKYLAGDEYTIADMISYPWTVGWEGQGQDISEFKHFKRWFDEIGNRPAVKRGMETGNNLRVDPCHPDCRGAGADAQDHVQPTRDPGSGVVALTRPRAEARQARASFRSASLANRLAPSGNAASLKS